MSFKINNNIRTLLFYLLLAPVLVLTGNNCSSLETSRGGSSQANVSSNTAIVSSNTNVSTADANLVANAAHTSANTGSSDITGTVGGNASPENAKGTNRIARREASRTSFAFSERSLNR